MIGEAITGFVGIFLGWLLTFCTTRKREKERTRQERITAANALLAEIDMIKERLLSVDPVVWPEKPKRDYNKALYHSLLPRLGLFSSESVRALVRFYQGIERIEAEAYACDSEEPHVRRSKHREDWALAVENTQKNLLAAVEKALESEIN